MKHTGMAYPINKQFASSTIAIQDLGNLNDVQYPCGTEESCLLAVTSTSELGSCVDSLLETRLLETFSTCS